MGSPEIRRNVFAWLDDLQPRPGPVMVDDLLDDKIVL